MAFAASWGTRAARERDAVGLHEARDGRGTGDGEGGRGGDGEHHDDRVGERRDVEQGLVGEPLGNEAVERRDSRDGKGTDEEADGRDRHAAEQAAHLLHVARTRGIEQGARAEEQLALEHGVVERVVEGGHERDRRDDVVARGVRRHGRADTEQDDADVLDGVVGQQALDVVLVEGVDDAQTDEMDPKTRTMRPHQSWTPEPASRSRPTLRIPGMPILIMPPDMRADTLDGASGCASGSQSAAG